MNFTINKLSNLRFINIETGQTHDLPNEVIEMEDISINEDIKTRTLGSCSASFSCDNAVINEEILFDHLKPNTFDFDFLS